MCNPLIHRSSARRDPYHEFYRTDPDMHDELNESTHCKIHDPALARQLADELLRIQAVILRPHDPMTWSSGWNSPIYCDNRLTLRYPELRERIRDGFVDLLKNRFDLDAIDVVTGTATAGIPHAAWVADALRKPMAYVRSKAKAHGLGNQIEGGVVKGENTVVLEDLISTGSSVMSVIDALEFVGVNVVGVVSIFTYGFDRADSAFRKRGIPVYSLTDYRTLIEVARARNVVGADDLATLNDWRSHPEKWPLPALPRHAEPAS